MDHGFTWIMEHDFSVSYRRHTSYGGVGDVHDVLFSALFFDHMSYKLRSGPGLDRDSGRMTNYAMGIMR